MQQETLSFQCFILFFNADWGENVCLHVLFKWGKAMEAKKEQESVFPVIIENDLVIPYSLCHWDKHVLIPVAGLLPLLFGSGKVLTHRAQYCPPYGVLVHQKISCWYSLECQAGNDITISIPFHLKFNAIHLKPFQNTLDFLKKE